VSSWFGQKERTFATSVGADFNQLGVAIGFLMGAFMVKESTDIKMLILAQAVATTIPAVLAAVFVRDRPMTPPSFGTFRYCTLDWENYLFFGYLSGIAKGRCGL
jgi:sugar phosphate permease